MIVAGADTTLIILSTYLAFALRFDTLTPFSFMPDAWVMLPMLALLGIALCYFVGTVHIKLHAFETNAVLRLGICALLLSVSAMVLSYLLGLGAPRSVPLILGAIFFFTSIVMRVGALSILDWLRGISETRDPVAIYGAGAAGIQLASALNQSREVKPVVFVDDNASLWGLIVSGLKVEKPARLSELVRKGRIRKVLLAMPSVPKARQNSLTVELESQGCEVQLLPSYVDIIAGKNHGNELGVVSPDELLGRDKVDLDIPDVAKAYAGRVVMVTGAGGSIGSELCRQLINCNPARIVLFEQSEFALYEIDRELRPMANEAGIEVTTRLGSVTNSRCVRSVIGQAGVDIVLHTAAYKHVPLVEENEIEGARNNILGTQIVAEAAKDAEIERFILVSTDKAVRPTNIMGGTKRMAELIVQDLQTRSSCTKFAMVRFGNVLGSSGSVLPLFESQIAAGGPVTVTHPEVTRYFMTIPEASRLVLLAGAFAEGGDLFVLNMGEPIKIIDVARRMITMLGHRVKENDVGDIEIVVTGLRPGEKLFEELLIDDESLVATPHEKILRAQETMLSQIEVAGMLRELEEALEQENRHALRALVAKRVEGYHKPELEAV